MIGLSGYRHPDYGMQDGVNLIEIDYDGNIVWEFDKFEEINDPGRDHRWMARQHHDYQREGNPEMCIRDRYGESFGRKCYGNHQSKRIRYSLYCCQGEK